MHGIFASDEQHYPAGYGWFRLECEFSLQIIQKRTSKKFLTATTSGSEKNIQHPKLHTINDWHLFAWVAEKLVRWQSHKLTKRSALDRPPFFGHVFRNLFATTTWKANKLVLFAWANDIPVELQFNVFRFVNRTRNAGFPIFVHGILLKNFFTATF